MENCIEFPQIIKHRITVCPSNPTSGQISKRIESRIMKRYLHIHIHSTIHNTQEVEATQCPSMGEQIRDKQNVTHIYSGVLFRLKKEILQYATTWMTLEGIMLGEVSSQIQRNGKYNGGYKGAGGKGGMGSCLMGTEFPICKMKKFWRSVSQHCKCT